jgi:hypothetical protein
VTGLIWYCVISGFLGFCGFCDSLAQPARAYRLAGVSKPLWVVINLVGMLSVVGGVLSFLVYSYGGPRRKVVKHGGYNRPTREKPVREMARYIDDEMQFRHGVSAPCQTCQAGGKVPCTCQGGWVTSPATNLLEQHIACGATGWASCSACGGTGQRTV